MFTDPSIKIQSNQWLDLSGFQFKDSGNKVFLEMLKFNKCTLRFAKSQTLSLQRYQSTSQRIDLARVATFP